MKVTVLLFAAAREIVDASSVLVEVPDSATTNALLDALSRAYPSLQDILKTSVLAVNHKYVDRDEDMPISAQDEIAVIPPVSGG
jgi:molybdopterin converting factor subunit 1